jgi:nucleoid-associated protein YgaU
MRANQARLGAGLAALAGLWIAVYWWWDPAPEPAIRFDTAAHTAPQPEPPPRQPAQRRPSSTPSSTRSPASGQAPGHAEALALDQPAGVLPPDFYQYVVQEDDTSLQDIARKLFGDPEAWVVIAQSNPVQDPARLKAGQVWKVPLDESNLQGVLVGADGRTITPPAQRAAPPKPEEFIEYVVQPGDSLSLISQRLYGTQRHTDLLFELNRGRLGLRSPDAIRAGQTLRAPRSVE